MMIDQRTFLGKRVSTSMNEDPSHSSRFKTRLAWPITRNVRLRTSLWIFIAALSGCATTERLPPQFQVGDVVVARHFNHYPQLNGTHVRVTGELKWRWIKGGNTLRCYAVETVDGQELAAQGFQLQSIAAQRSL
jgi:hypothetical protein